METAAQRHSHTAAPVDGSRTITILTHETPVVDGVGASASSGSLSREGGSAVGTLRLRASNNAQSVTWRDDVVDNEGCGKKKSKICCIFHKQRRFDESSSESGSDSDSSCDDAHDSNGHDQASPCRHRHPCGPNGNHVSDSGSDQNAYERLPKSRRWKTRRD
ncbi:phosphatase inhibitor-domain-containing protein [Pisolithus marmoratus]|nr:phosphatase inhibitor-domain-containing protein [Pisolithus marmoratus]